MAEQPDRSAADDVVISEDALEKAEQYIEAEEGALNRLTGWLGVFVAAIAVTMSVVHLYAAYEIVPTQALRMIHVAFVLFLTFVLFPFASRFRHRVCWWDWIGVALSLAVIGYGLAGGDDFTDRNAIPNRWDIVFGVILVALVLEATRRTTGWIMPAVCVAFLAYAMAGTYLPAPWTHRGYDLSRLTGHMYMTLEGIFGVAVDVSSSLIILFTIYGAFLQYSGAGKFFIDFSFAAMGGKPTGAGRTIVLASFLLGGPSGSGVATTVTLGSVAHSMLAKAGYGKDAAGGLLAAGGLGAIISPPVLGAAAFLIAEFLKISYLDVILMATIPTCLYYLALFVMVELDGRKFGARDIPFDRGQTLSTITKQFWFHFLSLVAIIAFMLIGFSPVLSVFWATATAFVVSFLHPDCALISYDLFRGKGPVWRHLLQSKLVKALEAGSVSVLSVAATCAAAGLIVGVVSLTGLGLRFSAIVIEYADGGSRAIVDALAVLGVSPTPALSLDIKLLLTALLTSLIVWVVGLAVPVTASYIICAVIAAPALIQLGVQDFAAHMFIFYYAVLSEVSPPTALSPFAAAAITGGNPYKTTMMAWKYTLPAFLVPFMFTLHPDGVGLLLKGSWENIFWTTVTAAVGLAALAAGLTGWLMTKTTGVERGFLIASGLVLVYPGFFQDIIGFVLVALALLFQYWRRKPSPPQPQGAA
jgi:TRAP transporter 4TM/12TM fusion protein